MMKRNSSYLRQPAVTAKSAKVEMVMEYLRPILGDHCGMAERVETMIKKNDEFLFDSFILKI